MTNPEAKTKETQNPPAEQSASSQQMARRSSVGGLMRPGFDPFFMNPREIFANPFALMRRMTEEMDRIFNQFGFEQGQRAGTTAWAPAIEVAEREGNYLIEAELPGLKPEDVRVEVTEDSLVLEGERKWEEESKQGGMQRSERRYGRFYRAIPLPEGVNPEQVRARFENGVLQVTVPMPQTQSSSRQIPIETGKTGAGAAAGSSQAAKA
jgi:HSP20 family protein